MGLIEQNSKFYLMALIDNNNSLANKQINRQIFLRLLELGVILTYNLGTNLNSYKHYHYHIRINQILQIFKQYVN